MGRRTNLDLLIESELIIQRSQIKADITGRRLMRLKQQTAELTASAKKCLTHPNEVEIVVEECHEPTGS